MENTIDLKINFNPFAPSIEAQLRKQRLKFHSDSMGFYQVLKENIYSLYVQDVLTNGQKEKANKRLFNKIKLHVKKYNQLKRKKQ